MLSLIASVSGRLVIFCKMILIISSLKSEVKDDTFGSVESNSNFVSAKAMLQLEIGGCKQKFLGCQDFKQKSEM